MKIKKIISFAALLCGLIIIFAAAPQETSAQVGGIFGQIVGNFIPPGSYQKSCKNISTKGVTLSATCNPKGESALSEFFGGKKFTNPTADLPNYFECEGSIWNDDGQLKCNRNLNSALIQKAKKTLSLNYNIVTGLDFGEDYSTFRNYLNSMFADGLVAQFYDGKLGNIFDVGGASYDWFVKHFNQPSMAEIKQQIITRAFYDVYGTSQVPPTDFAKYNAMQISYNDIVLAEKKKMNAPPLGAALRTLMITHAYNKSLGRSPVKAEYDYWTPKKEVFKDIVEASRFFMYAPNGAKDLSETVQRKLIAKGNKNPTPNQINDAISKYSAMKVKPIYDEM